MGDLFNRVFGRERKSAQQAKERLKLVLIHDRAALNQGKIDLLKDELIESTRQLYGLKLPKTVASNA